MIYKRTWLHSLNYSFPIVPFNIVFSTWRCLTREFTRHHIVNFGTNTWYPILAACRRFYHVCIEPCHTYSSSSNPACNIFNLFMGHRPWFPHFYLQILLHSFSSITFLEQISWESFFLLQTFWRDICIKEKTRHTSDSYRPWNFAIFIFR